MRESETGQPDELGTVRGRARFDEVGRAVAAGFPAVLRWPFTDVEINPAKAFAADGFHP